MILLMNQEDGSFVDDVIKKKVAYATILLKGLGSEGIRSC